jgi:hypothetical protein
VGLGLAGPDRAGCGTSNSKTRGKDAAKGRALRAVEFMSELKLRPTKREAGASRRRLALMRVNDRKDGLYFSVVIDGGASEPHPSRETRARSMGHSEIRQRKFGWCGRVRHPRAKLEQGWQRGDVMMYSHRNGQAK